MSKDWYDILNQDWRLKYLPENENPNNKWDSLVARNMMQRLGIDRAMFDRIFKEWTVDIPGAGNFTDPRIFESYAEGRVLYNTLVSQPGGREKFYNEPLAIAPPVMNREYSNLAKFGISRREVDRSVVAALGSPLQGAGFTQEQFSKAAREAYPDILGTTATRPDAYWAAAQAATLQPGKSVRMENFAWGGDVYENNELMWRGEGTPYPHSAFLAQNYAPSGIKQDTVMSPYDIRDPNQAAKRMKVTQKEQPVYNMPELFLGNQNVTSRYKLGAEGLVRGYLDDVAVPLLDWNTEGSTMEAERGLEFRWKTTRFTDIEPGRKYFFEPEGKEWNLTSGEKVNIHKGGAALDIRGAGSVVMGQTTRGFRPTFSSSGEYQGDVETYISILEYRKSGQEANAFDKTAFSKSTLGTYTQDYMNELFDPARYGARFAETGVQSLLQTEKNLKDVSATISPGVEASQYSYIYGKYLHLLAGDYYLTHRDEAQQVLQMNDADFANFSWSNNPRNRELYDAFMTKVVPEHTRDIVYTKDIHPDQLSMYQGGMEPQYFGNGDVNPNYVPPEQLRNGNIRITSKPIPTVFLPNMLRQFGTQGTGSSSYVAGDVLRNIMESGQEEYHKTLMAAGQVKRDLAQSVVDASLANTASFKDSLAGKVLQATPQMVGEIYSNAVTRALKETPEYKDASELPSSVLAHYIVEEAASSQYGKSFIDFGGVIAAPAETVKAMSRGGQESDEMDIAYGSRYARMVEAVLKGNQMEIDKALGNFNETQMELAKSESLQRNFTGTYAPGKSIFRVAGGAEDIAGNVTVIPSQTVADAFGLPINSMPMQRFFEQARRGEIFLPTKIDRAPTTRSTQVAPEMTLKGLPFASYLAGGGRVLQEENVLMSSLLLDAKHTDTDGDYIRAMFDPDQLQYDRKTKTWSWTKDGEPHFAQREDLEKMAEYLGSTVKREFNTEDAKKRLDAVALGTMYEYGEEDENVASITNAQMKKRVGYDYNTAGLVRAMGKSFGLEREAEDFANVIYRREQIPETLSPEAMKVLDIMGTSYEGGYTSRVPGMQDRRGSSIGRLGFGGLYVDAVESAFLAEEFSADELKLFLPQDMYNLATPEFVDQLRSSSPEQQQSMLAAVRNSLMTRSPNVSQLTQESVIGQAIMSRGRAQRDINKGQRTGESLSLTPAQTERADKLNDIRAAIRSMYDYDKSGNVKTRKTVEEQALITMRAQELAEEYPTVLGASTLKISGVPQTTGEPMTIQEEIQEQRDQIIRGPMGAQKSPGTAKVPEVPSQQAAAPPGGEGPPKPPQQANPLPDSDEMKFRQLSAYRTAESRFTQYQKFIQENTIPISNAIQVMGNPPTEYSFDAPYLSDAAEKRLLETLVGGEQGFQNMEARQKQREVLTMARMGLTAENREQREIATRVKAIVTQMNKLGKGATQGKRAGESIRLGMSESIEEMRSLHMDTEADYFATEMANMPTPDAQLSQDMQMLSELQASYGISADVISTEGGLSAVQAQLTTFNVKPMSFQAGGVPASPARSMFDLEVSLATDEILFTQNKEGILARKDLTEAQKKSRIANLKTQTKKSTNRSYREANKIYPRGAEQLAMSEAAGELLDAFGEGPPSMTYKQTQDTLIGAQVEMGNVAKVFASEAQLVASRNEPYAAKQERIAELSKQAMGKRSSIISGVAREFGQEEAGRLATGSAQDFFASKLGAEYVGQPNAADVGQAVAKAEKSLLEITERLTEARKLIVEQTRATPAAERDARMVLAEKPFVDEARGVFSTLREEAGAAGTVGFAGGDEFGNIDIALGGGNRGGGRGKIGPFDRGSLEGAMYQAKRLLTPFSPEGALIRATWNMVAGDAMTKGVQAYQGQYQQGMQMANLVGPYTGVEQGPGVDIAAVANRQQAAQVAAGRAGMQAWGWTQGLTGESGAEARAVYGPALAAGIVTKIGLKATLGGILSAPAIGMAATGVGLGAAAIATGVYGYNIGLNTAENQYMAYRDQQNPNLWTGFKTGVRDFMGGYSAPTDEYATGSSGFTLPTGVVPGGSRTDMLIDQFNRFKDIPLAQQTSVQRTQTLQWQRDQLMQNPNIATFGVPAVNNAMNEILTFGDVKVGEDLTQRYGRAIEVIAATGAGPSMWSELASGTNMGASGAMELFDRFNLGQGLTGQGLISAQQSFRQWAPLSNYGVEGGDIGRISSKVGLLTGQNANDLQKLLGGDQRFISRAVMGVAGQGLTAATGIDMQGMYGLQSQDMLGLPVGTSGELQNLIMGITQLDQPSTISTARSSTLSQLGVAFAPTAGQASLKGGGIWDRMPNVPKGLPQATTGAQIKQAYQQAYPNARVFDNWNGESIMDLQNEWTQMNVGWQEEQLQWKMDEYQWQYGVDAVQQAQSGQPLTMQTVGGIFKKQANLAQQGIGLQAAGGALSFKYQRLGMELNKEQFMENQAFALEGIEIGRGFQQRQNQWQLEDLGTAISRGRTQFGWQSADLERSYERSTTQFGWRETDMLRGRQMELLGNQYQDFQMGQRQVSTQMGRGYQQEDWATNRSTNQMQFGWKMEDYERDIRFATGRQRESLVRGQERDTTMQNLAEERFDVQEDRAREMWTLEDQAFEKEKGYIEETRKLKDDAYEDAVDRFEEEREWGTEDYEISKERNAQQRGWQEEDWAKQLARLQESIGQEDIMYERQIAKHAMEIEHFDESHALQEQKLVEEEALFGAQIGHAQRIQALQNEIGLYRADMLAKELAQSKAVQSSKPAVDSLITLFTNLSDTRTTKAIDKFHTFTDMVLHWVWNFNNPGYTPP